MLRLVARNVSEFHLGSADHTPHFSQPAINTNATCPVVWSVFRTMPKADQLIDCRCKHASNTFAATKRQVTFAPRKSCSPSSRRCTRFITGHVVCERLPNACIAEPVSLLMVCARSDQKSLTTIFSTRSELK